jgi:retinol dehydrogenase-12
VTGGNGGLGREAIRHFVGLGAAKVVLACRSVEKGEAARAEIEAAGGPLTGAGVEGVVEVWNVDLASFESVRQFCRRAEAELERIDVLVANAGLLMNRFVEADDGWESQIAVNVISTFLMALMLLPKMRETAARCNVVPRIVVVTSNGHFFVRLLTPDCPVRLPNYLLTGLCFPRPSLGSC